MPSTSTPVDIREHLAAERTLLAYVRTGLALMGFGFVVARFGLFLREIRFVQSGSQLPPNGRGRERSFGTPIFPAGAAPEPDCTSGQSDFLGGDWPVTVAGRDRSNDCDLLASFERLTRATAKTKARRSFQIRRAFSNS
jgi:Domain of unknown function (DUF202)